MSTLAKSFMLGTTGAIALLFSLIFGNIPTSLRKETSLSNLYARVFPIYFGCINIIFVYANNSNVSDQNMLIFVISIFSSIILFLIAFLQNFYDLNLFGWSIYILVVFLLHVFILLILSRMNKMFGLIK